MIERSKKYYHKIGKWINATELPIKFELVEARDITGKLAVGWVEPTKWNFRKKMDKIIEWRYIKKINLSDN